MTFLDSEKPREGEILTPIVSPLRMEHGFQTLPKAPEHQLQE